MKTELDFIITEAKHKYLRVEVETLQAQTSLRADYVSELVSLSVRDLFLMTRYYGWLFFGGVGRADSFTEYMEDLADRCREYANDRNMSECPGYDDNLVCDCAWGETSFPTCRNYSYNTRHLQLVNYFVEATDSLPDGDRNFTSFPEVATSPNATRFWSNPATVPGWEKGSSAAGHDTLYDRLRVASAMPLHQVIYNADKEKDVSLNLGFEADGLYIGWGGCTNGWAGLSMWNSTEANRAAEMRPELCPLGKYGYDPRCRSWYHTGRQNAIEENSTLHITAPYVYAGTNAFVAQSATSPLIDPHTGQHVGQVLNDFRSTNVANALVNETTLATGGFSILIAVQGSQQENAVIGPNYTVDDSKRGVASALVVDPTEISVLVLPFDHGCSTALCAENLESFRMIVESMNRGEEDRTSFRRSTLDGGIETVHISYAPVNVNNPRPVDPSNFARGVEVSEYMVYSLALCETEEGIFDPFKEIERDATKQVPAAVAILAIGIFLSALFVVFVSYTVARSITEPMVILRDLIRSINR